MSPIDLVILGFLKKRSMSAYELTKIAELQDLPSTGGKSIIKQYRLVFAGMIQWIEELIQEYENE